MSYSDILSCRDHFTTEQVQRMRAHLAGHDSLQNVIIPPLVLPGDTLPSGPSNSIVVDSGELHITSTLEMLPGAYIWVKPGATLRVSAKITGACGQMWRGVIVQGDDKPQLPVYQGRVIVDNNGPKPWPDQSKLTDCLPAIIPLHSPMPMGVLQAAILA